MSAAVAAQLEALVSQSVQEAVLDDQFSQLLQLQDESNPHFVAEVVELYFEDSTVKIDRLQQLIAQPRPDFQELDGLVHQFKGSSASLGATMMSAVCIKLREACQRGDIQACQQLLHEVRHAYALLKAKLDLFLQLEAQRKQLMAAGQ